MVAELIRPENQKAEFAVPDLQHLRRLRTEGDPETDKLVQQLRDEGKIPELNVLLRTLGSRHDLHSCEDLRQTIRFAIPNVDAAKRLNAWIDDQLTLPADVDLEKLRRAARVFEEHGPVIGLLLVTASLVHSYAAPVGATTLSLTYRLEHDVKRRIGETAQFVLANMDPDGFDPVRGMALPTILKVRLLHAAIRCAIKEFAAEKSWGQVLRERVAEQVPPSELQRVVSLDEVPLPREDQLGALMSFSFIVLKGLKRLGVDLEPEEEDAYLYHWCLVGRKLGIPASLLPTNVEQAKELTQAVWDDRVFLGTIDGISMARATLEMFKHDFPGLILRVCGDEPPDWFQGLVGAVLRRAVDPEIADKMKVPRDRLWDTILDPPFLLRPLVAFGNWLAKLVFRKPIDEVARRLVVAGMRGNNRYQPAAFTIPESLEQHWRDAGMLKKKDANLWFLAGVHWSAEKAKRKAKRLGRFRAATPAPRGADL